MTSKENETDKEMTLTEKENESVEQNLTSIKAETEKVSEVENLTSVEETEKEDLSEAENLTSAETEKENETVEQNVTLNETENAIESEMASEKKQVVVKENMTLKEKHFEISLNWLSKKSATSIKTNSEGYEAPKSYTNKETGEKIQPDFSFLTPSGYTCFTEIALKTESPRKLVTRWKLLSLMANAKRGKLHLLTPKGHKMFTKKLVDNHNINALVHSI